jgi:hypothetical protein
MKLRNGGRCLDVPFDHHGIVRGLGHCLAATMECQSLAS